MVRVITNMLAFYRKRIDKEHREIIKIVRRINTKTRKKTIWDFGTFNKCSTSIVLI